jgi:hypothetical protein
MKAPDPSSSHEAECCCICEAAAQVIRHNGRHWMLCTADPHWRVALLDLSPHPASNESPDGEDGGGS